MRELLLHKIKQGQDAVHYVTRERFFGKKIVFTNGCFDVLHIGHIRLLLEAANAGDILVVGLNSDASVKRLKGEKRPIHTQDVRAEMLASLIPVDCIILFEEDTPADLIKMVKPDVIVKGGDYSENEIIGADFVKSYGGEIKIFPLEIGYSTTQIISKSVE
jgi:rfaE bifunctional protein nucleotidyltransferase chain/domain